MLEDQVRRIASPTLLISAGTAEEREFNEHWSLPDAEHTHGVERRVVAFFDAALGR